MRFTFLFAILVFVTPLSVSAGAGAQTQSAPTSETRKPNIVFIFTDDLGYGDISAFGATDVKTPHIDSLAARGAKFTQLYSASPVCTPSRAGLLTGRLPIRMGIHHVFMPGSYAGMPESEITIAEILKAEGYATAIVGKWHLGHHKRFLPLNQGFDEFFGIPYSNDMTPLPLMRGNDYIEDRIDQSTLTQRLTQDAVNFIDRHTDQPFFLYLAHPMPHVPIFRSKSFEGVSERGAYGDVIEELDASVGGVLATLERHDLSDNTLVVFTSDNGPWLLMGDTGGSAGDLRNGKGTTFEGGVRVPLLAVFPDVIPAGRTVETPVSMLDWVPTLATLAGAKLPDDRDIDGQDLAPVWTENGAPANDRILPFYSHGILEAIRVGKWKLKRPYDSSAVPIPGIVKFFLKGEYAVRSHGILLFDLEQDPGEQENLATTYPNKVTELQKIMQDFEATLGKTPPSITDIDLTIKPPVKVLIGAIAKVILSALAALSFVIAIVFFLLGRRSGLKRSCKT